MDRADEPGADHGGADRVQAARHGGGHARGHLSRRSRWIGPAKVARGSDTVTSRPCSTFDTLPRPRSYFDLSSAKGRRPALEPRVSSGIDATADRDAERPADARPRAGSHAYAALPDEVARRARQRPRRDPPGALARRARSSSPGPASDGRSSRSASASCSNAASSARAMLGPSTGGRPPRQLTFRADAGHVLVADLGATSIDVAVTTLDGRILGHHDEPARDRGRARDAAWTASTRCSTPSRHDPRHPRSAVGHRHRRARTGRVRDRPADLAADHARLGRLPDPRAVRGRATAPRSGSTTTSTCWLSASGGRASRPGHDNVVVVKIGTGIGAGIISDGRLHRGAQGSAGDVGHIQVTDDPAVICRCGNIGCLEALAGGAALGRDGEAAAAGRSQPAAARRRSTSTGR